MKLSEKLKAMRINRPDEWTMDEFIRDSLLLEKALEDFLIWKAESQPEIPGFKGTKDALNKLDIK